MIWQLRFVFNTIRPRLISDPTLDRLRNIIGGMVWFVPTA